MTLFGKLRGFVRDDRGAVTVDWVVLTAAVVILGIGAVAAIDAGIEGLMIGMWGPLDG